MKLIHNYSSTARAKAIRKKSIALLFIFVCDLLVSSVASAAQSSALNVIDFTHDSFLLMQNDSQPDVLPCHELDSQMHYSGMPMDSADNMSDMPCCDDDCSSCHLFVSIIKAQPIIIPRIKLSPSLIVSPIAPLSVGVHASIYRPPTLG